MTISNAATDNKTRQPSLVDALVPLLFMILLLATSIFLFGIDAAVGPLQGGSWLAAFGKTFGLRRDPPQPPGVAAEPEALSDSGRRKPSRP